MKKTVDTSNDRLYCTSRKKRVVLQICKCTEVGTEVAGFPHTCGPAPAQFVGNFSHGRWAGGTQSAVGPPTPRFTYPSLFPTPLRLIARSRPPRRRLGVAANCRTQK